MNAVATVGTSRVGQELLAVAAPLMKRYADRVGAQFLTLTKDVSPGYPLANKFAVRQLLGRYDRVLFLDADVVVHPDCPSLFEVVPEDVVGLYDDTPDLTVSDWLDREYAGLCESQGWEAVRPPHCYNTGAVVLSRGHERLFDPPTRPYPRSHCAEQSLVNLNVARNGLAVQKLDRSFNWQWWSGGRDRFVESPAHLYHFAGANDPATGGTTHQDRLAAMRALADRLYPNKGRCRFRGEAPVQRAGGCCGADPALVEASHEYHCDRFDASCCAGFGLLALKVRRCRACPAWEAP